MDNNFIEFGIMLGFWVAANQLIDTFTLKLGHMEFPSMWAGVVAVLLVGLGIAAYRKIKSNG
jgi:uncharacterized membrane protein